MIGGNIKGLLQKKGDRQKNAIGELTHEWKDTVTLTGWLDLSGGDSKYANYSAKMQESTHVFISDFVDLTELRIDSENSRMVIKDRVYEILLIDNPMEMDLQLEIYLKYVGG